MFLMTAVEVIMNQEVVLQHQVSNYNFIISIFLACFVNHCM